jgi:hypothetical protein
LPTPPEAIRSPWSANIIAPARSPSSGTRRTPSTRAKLLVALGLDQAYHFVGEKSLRPASRFERGLAERPKGLSADQRKDVARFAAAVAPRSSASGAGELVTAIGDAMK